MAQASRAYDLDLFQPRKPHLVELKNTKKATEDNRRRSRRQSVLNLIVYLAIAAIAVVLVGYFITCNVQLTEMNKALSDKQTQLSALQSEAVRLKSEMAGKTSAEKVNAYVQENGLNPINSNQIYYIEATEEDQVSLPEENGNWLEQAWNAIVDFLS
jgi:cell division protein FtsL